MALFHRNKQNVAASSQDIASWENPVFNYMAQNQLPFAHFAQGIVQPAPVAQAPAITAARGDPSAWFSLPQNFPSPLSLFNGPRNIFGS